MKGELCGGLGKVGFAGVSEHAMYFRPAGLAGVEALHARFVEHAYMPHSHPTWTVAVVQHGAARFEVDATRQRADRGELFVLEPEAVHTGMAAVPEGWAYKVLYLDPALLHDWDERDRAGPASGALGGVPRPRAAGLAAACARGDRDGSDRARARRGGARSGRGAAPAPAARTGARPRRLRARGRAAGPGALLSNGTSPCRWPTLSSVAGLTRFELVRRFRRHTGLTPHAFQTNLRIAQARGMLARGEAAARVAAQCGFADQSHLTRTFKRAVGVTPARFAAA